MDFLISNAWAQAAPPPAANPISSILFMVVIFVVFYFILIRPQAKRAKEHKKMVAALAKGDEMVTNGGIAGKIIEAGDSFIKVEIADGVQVRVQRSAVSSILPKGTLKNL